MTDTKTCRHPVARRTVVPGEGERCEICGTRTGSSSLRPSTALAQFSRLVAEELLAERLRQVNAEGYDADHDDVHDRDELALGAAYYALPASVRQWMDGNDVKLWPFADEAKSEDRRRDLIKAGAMIVAEIERLDRAMAGAAAAEVPDDRDDRQQLVYEWALRCFGERSMTLPERAARVLEEAIELAQAEGLSLEACGDLARFVYAKPAGDPAQEVGGIAVTLLCYCQVKGLSGEAAEVAEIRRVLSKTPEHFAERHAVKRAAGVAA
jgi:hypothetical protein